VFENWQQSDLSISVQGQPFSATAASFQGGVKAGNQAGSLTLLCSQEHPTCCLVCSFPACGNKGCRNEGFSLQRQMVESLSLEVIKNIVDLALRNTVSGHGEEGLTVGLDDLRGLFQPL